MGRAPDDAHYKNKISKQDLYSLDYFTHGG